MRKLLVILFISTISCQNDVERVSIKGVVSNDETGLPMANIKISFICWFYGDSVDESYTGKEKRTVITNNEGEYEVMFDKAAFLEIRIRESGFAEIHDSKYISSRTNTMNIKVRKE